MIFYFSGTGNSHWVAETLQKSLEESMVSIAEALRQEKGNLIYSLDKKEKMIFVFPVHSWGPAVLVKRFIARLRILNYDRQPVYFVCTCGDDCGRTDQVMRKLLAQRGLSLTAGFSVQMPNTYVLLPGFDVDNEEVEHEKLRQAPLRIQKIVTNIKEGKNESLYVAGSFPSLKTMVYPIFTNFVIGKTKFYATDACISCGLCAKVCPTDTIVMTEGKKPTWKNTCVQCMACYHRCPTHAIEYGKISLNKGHYYHPDLKKTINK